MFVTIPHKYEHRVTQHYIVLHEEGSSSSLSCKGMTLSPTMLSITLSRGPPFFFSFLTSFLFLGAAITVSRADLCFLEGCLLSDL